MSSLLLYNVLFFILEINKYQQDTKALFLEKNQQKKILNGAQLLHWLMNQWHNGEVQTYHCWKKDECSFIFSFAKKKPTAVLSRVDS